MSKIIPEKILIYQIRIYKINLNLSDQFLLNPKKPENYSIQFGHENAVDFEAKAIRIRLETILDGMNDKDEKLGVHAEYGIEFHFHVDNLEDFVEENENGKQVDSVLGTTILSIAFSTSRGIIIERTQGTYLEGIILPVIDPKELLMNSINDK